MLVMVLMYIAGKVKDEKREHCDNYGSWSITSAGRVRVQVNNKGN